MDREFIFICDHRLDFVVLIIVEEGIGVEPVDPRVHDKAAVLTEERAGCIVSIDNRYRVSKFIHKGEVHDFSS